MRHTILVDNTGVALDDLDDLVGDILVHVVGHGQAEVAVPVHLHSHVHGLQQVVAVDARQNEAALSSASGRSVEVRMQTAGNGWPTLVKKLLSSGSVPESDTTQKAFICRQL